MGASGICLCYHPHPYNGPLLHHVVASEFTQMHQLFCGFCLAHPILCRGQALPTLGITEAWVMAMYLRGGDIELGWGCTQWAGAAVNCASHPSPSSEPQTMVCGSEYQGWFALASDPEHSDISIRSIWAHPHCPSGLSSAGLWSQESCSISLKSAALGVLVSAHRVG